VRWYGFWNPSGRVKVSLLVHSEGVNLAFVVTSLIVVATPGTGALLTISAGLSRGRRASLVTAVGCTLGIVPHLVAAVTGTAVLLRASGVAFELVKVAGVVYLAWMAVATWRDHSTLSTEPQPVRSPGRVVGSAVLANLLNPKLTIFFFAFLPQFVPVGPGATARMAALSAVFMAMTLIVFAGYGVFAAAVSRHLLTRPRVVRRVRQTFAASFLGLGAKLATTNR